MNPLGLFLIIPPPSVRPSVLVYQENAEREVKEQKRQERERELVEKRRSIAVCSGPELGLSLARDPQGGEGQDDLERMLEKGLNHSWSRRSLRSSDLRRYSHHLQPSANHLLNPPTFNAFPELGTSPTSTGGRQGNLSGHRTPSVLGGSAETNSKQETVAGGPTLSGCYQAGNHNMETFQGSNVEKIKPSPHDVAFKVTQQNPDSISYVSQFRHEKKMSQASERETKISHGLMDSETDVSVFTSCSNSPAAATPSTPPLSVKSQNSTARHRFGMPVTDSACPTPPKTKAKDSSDTESSQNSLIHITGIQTPTHSAGKPRHLTYHLSESQSPSSAHDHDALQSQMLFTPGMELTTQMLTETASTPGKENWISSGLPEAHNYPGSHSSANNVERPYPCVGETLECHTLVKGLRSYNTLSSPTSPLPRPTPSPCSKWRKEREDLQEVSTPGSLTPKGEAQATKTPVRSGVGAKRGLMSRSTTPANSGIPRVHPKTEPSGRVSSPADSSHPPRLNTPLSASAGVSPIARSSAAQTDVKRSNSARERVQHRTEQQGSPAKSLLTRRTSERSLPEKAGTTNNNNNNNNNHTAFVRGTPVRVSKRLAPNSESQGRSQHRAAHSPTSATAKTIRTAVISAARNKAAKDTGTDVPVVDGKLPAATRIPGLKVARSSTPQRLWK